MKYRDLIKRAARVEEETHAEFKEAVEAAGRAKRQMMGGKRKRLPHDQRESLFNKQNGRCALSGDPLEEQYTEDHIIPFSFGGGEDAKNKRLANRRPNQLRGNKVKTSKLYRFLTRGSSAR
jgi:CRISPR/Cas system Type II protein with McrA/HNH and RuvC-like nuclease domain